MVYSPSFSPEQQRLHAMIVAYQHAFTQPYPKYGKKFDDHWRMIGHKLGYQQVQQHIMQQGIVGTLGRWYPSYGILDFDDVTLDYVRRTQDRLGLDAKNSMIFSSESANSYHVYFKPRRGGNLVTLQYYTQAMTYAKNYAEVYPQAQRVIRLPFGQGQYWVDGTLLREIDVAAGMQQLAQLQEFELRALPYQGSNDQELDDWGQGVRFGGLQSGWKQQGLTYLNEGLQALGTRLEATKRVIYFFWTQNVTPEVCKEQTKNWIKHKHNGCSEDWQKNFRRVYQQIDRLTHWLYDHFARHYILPDIPSIEGNGYLTPTAVRQVVAMSAGSLPLLKFSSKLVSHVITRGGSKALSIHRNKLVEWSSEHTYKQYLERLEQKNWLTRGSSYSSGSYAKRIKLACSQGQLSEMITSEQDQERPAQTLQEWIPAVFSQEEYYHTQKAFGLNRKALTKQIAHIWGEDKLPIVNIRAKQNNEVCIAQFYEDNPQVTQKLVAQKLEIGLRTVKTNKVKKQSSSQLIKAYLKVYPNATQKQVAQRLGLSLATIKRHWLSC